MSASDHLHPGQFDQVRPGGFFAGKSVGQMSDWMYKNRAKHIGPLEDNILMNGGEIRQPVTLHPDTGELLDGQHRMSIAYRHGLSVPVRRMRL